MKINLELFHSKYSKSATSGCWEWQGALSDGYGRLLVRGHFNKAHRVSYRIHFGKIPDGLMVLHKCNNRRCVNPDHLYAGTHGNNMRDRKLAGTYGRDFNGRTKVSSEQAELIRKVYKEFMVSYALLAKVAGVDKAAIAGIIKQEEK